MSDGPPAGRKVTDVAVGVLLRPDGAVLLADRPAGKPYAGYWEFPGGKIEAGESIEHALARELHEELGIDIGPATPWVTFEFDYPHAYVRLHFRRVRQWRGTPHGREGQRMTFFRLDGERPAPLLPAAVPALRWLGLPEVVAEVDLDRGPASVQLAQVDAALAHGVRMLLVRSASAQASMQVAEVLAALGARVRAHSALLVVEAALAGRAAGAIDGTHVGALADVVPAPGELLAWRGADASSSVALTQWARAGGDYAIVGPVLPMTGPHAGAGAIGWHGLSALVRSAPLPVLARGGVSLDDLSRAQAIGAHGLVLPVSNWRRAEAQPR